MTSAKRPPEFLHDPTIKRLGLASYESVFEQMRSFTHQRSDQKQQVSSNSKDEIWIVQHPPVYTQGVRSKDRPRGSSSIPVVKSDRGGLISYHGPGQVILYPLLTLAHWNLDVKKLVARLEQSVIDLLSEYSITGKRKLNAPGVYVDGKKIAALGLRVRRGYSYHGLSLNVDMDLSPFDDIDPCGFEDLGVTQLKDLGVRDSADAAGEGLLRIFLQQLRSG